MFAHLSRWCLTVCTFVACFRSVSTVARSSPIRKVRTSSKESLNELSTFTKSGIENMARHSKNEVEQDMMASTRPARIERHHAIADSSEVREEKTLQKNGLEALIKRNVSMAKSNGAHLNNRLKWVGSTQHASNHSKELDQVQRASRTNDTSVGVLLQPSVGSKGKSGGVLLGSTIKSHVMRVPKTEMQKSVLPDSSEMLVLVKDRKLQPVRQEVDPDGTVTAASDLKQVDEKVQDLHPSTQILPNGQSRALVRTERSRASHVGRLELGGTGNEEGVSLQAPQTSPVQQAPVPVVGAPGVPPVAAAPTSPPPDSQQGSTFLGSLGSTLLFIVLLGLVALGSFWLGQRSTFRGHSNEMSFQQPSGRSEGSPSKYNRASIWSRASMRGRGTDDDDASSASEAPSRHGDSLSANKLQRFVVGDRVKVLKQTRLKGKTATIIDPCWKIVNGQRMVQVRMDFKDEKGEVKSFKEIELELIHTFQVGDRVRVVKQTRLKGKTAIVIDPCWRKTDGFTLVQVRMDEKDVKGDVKSFTQGDLEPERGGN